MQFNCFHINVELPSTSISYPRPTLTLNKKTVVPGSTRLGHVHSWLWPRVLTAATPAQPTLGVEGLLPTPSLSAAHLLSQC